MLRVFDLPATVDATQVFEEVQQMAVDAGWKIDEVVGTGRDQAFVAEREIDGEPSRLTVSLNSDPDRGPAPGLTVSLSAGVE